MHGAGEFDEKCKGSADELRQLLNCGLVGQLYKGRRVLYLIFGNGRAVYNKHLEKAISVHTVDFAIAGVGAGAGFYSDEAGTNRWVRDFMIRGAAREGPPQHYDLVIALDLFCIVDRPERLLVAINALLSTSGIAVASCRTGQGNYCRRAENVFPFTASAVFKAMAVTELGSNVRWFARSTSPLPAIVPEQSSVCTALEGLLGHTDEDLKVSEYDVVGIWQRFDSQLVAVKNVIALKAAANRSDCADGLLPFKVLCLDTDAALTTIKSVKEGKGNLDVLTAYDPNNQRAEIFMQKIDYLSMANSYVISSIESSRATALERELAELRRQRDELLRSTSWRLTAPLRTVSHMLRGLWACF
jgi:hypothetical protein